VLVGLEVRSWASLAKLIWEVDMIGCIGAILLVISGFLSPEVQTPSNEDNSPSVSVLLPPNIPSDTVQISYFLIGPFGGHGSYTKQRPGLQTYEIPASVDGKPANEIRMIVYAGGCEIKTFVLSLSEDSRVKQAFECQPAATVQLSGQIVPTELARRDNSELVIYYMAHWAHGFYGISDGMVTEFRVASASPDSNGVFQVQLPYFGSDVAVSSSTERASFWLMLRDSKTWNPLTSHLESELPDLRFKGNGLPIRTHYPDGLKFTSGTLCKRDER
jgi:hypothetical protein